MKKIPRPDSETEEFFRSVVPSDTAIRVRPMFGNEAAFVNGNRFMGLFGSGMFVRLSEDDRSEFLRKEGTSLFEPMKGRPMKEYVMIPEDWLGNVEAVRPWVSRSLRWASRLPKK